MSDNSRQEVEIELGGKTYRCRPTFQVIVGIEAATGQPSRSLGLKCLAYGLRMNQRGGIDEISLSEIATVVSYMVRDQEGAPKTIVEVGDLLMEEGYGGLCAPVADFLMRAQRGNREHLKDLERRAEKESKGPPAKGPVSKAA